jgi:plastocyanin
MKKFLIAIALTMLASPALAKDYTVKMITERFTKNPYRFEPDHLTIQPGDTVIFVNAQNDKHDVMFEAVPKGAEFVMSPMLRKKGETWPYKFTKEGTYQYHCHPHEEWGMTGVIIVGKPSKPADMQKEEHDDDGEGGDMPGMKDMNMKGMDHSGMENMKGMDHGAHDMGGMPGMAHGEHMAMTGFYGAYAMNREASGTAWVPESTPMEGIHAMYGSWMTMIHGNVDLVYDHQGGRRGDDKTFTEGMIMAMANRPLGGGIWGLRAMLSPDPLMGKSGYPLLLQTGETADGKNPLVDRQHPHDLFMELATTYSHPVDKDSTVFGYIGYPGEPALGPATFMHRFSGMDNPEAPIGHHWLDSTHVDFGVATLGYIWQNWKLEGSIFNGREPDQFRWNFDQPHLNSYSARLTYNPTANWSLQVSHGYLKSPEQLEPDTNQRRTTASAMYNLPFGKNNWQTTLAWGLDDNDPGHATNAALLESAITLHDTHTFFGRAEWVQKDELFNTGPLAGQTFDVGKLSAGYIYDILVAAHLKLGIGGLGSMYALPGSVRPSYGSDPLSAMVFVRLKLM